MNAEGHEPNSDTVIELLKTSKVVGAGGGVVMVLAGGVFIWAGTTIDPGWPWYGIGVLAVLFGILTAVRIPRSRVTLRQDEMVVYGQVWARTVPGQAITSIIPWPCVKWTDARGRKHATPISVLNATGALPVFAQHAREGRDTLRKWAGVGGEYRNGRGRQLARSAAGPRLPGFGPRQLDTDVLCPLEDGFVGYGPGGAGLVAFGIAEAGLMRRFLADADHLGESATDDEADFLFHLVGDRLPRLITGVAPAVEEDEVRRHARVCRDVGEVRERQCQ